MSTGYLRRNTNYGYQKQGHNNDFNFDSPAPQKFSSFAKPEMASWEVESIIAKIQSGHYRYYVKGGFKRGNGLVMTAEQVAIASNADLNLCLFEVDSPRVLLAVQEAGLIFLTPATCRGERRDSRMQMQRVEPNTWRRDRYERKPKGPTMADVWGKNNVR